MSSPSFTEDDAITAALDQKWEDAIKINSTLLKSQKNNVSILNRLGYAYLQNGNITLAKTTFNKVIKIDPYNQIASKNLKKLTNVKQKDMRGAVKNTMTPMSFLEEPGKTKIVECIHVAPVQALSATCPGEEVTLKARNHTVEVRSSQNTYLAALPDDVSFRLIKFMAAGYTYQALMKSIEKNKCVLFVREMSRGTIPNAQSTFAPSAVYVPFTRTDVPEDKPMSNEDQETIEENTES